MKPSFIAVSGGTGAGKSTACFGLVDAFPDEVSIVHLDDYQNRAQAPLTRGFTNLDHPEAVNFAQLISDLKALSEGDPITVQTKNEKYNPQAKTIGRLPMIIKPTRVMLIEGYLSLWNDEIRDMLANSVYLELNYETRIKRRTKFMDPDYEKNVLVPMHKKYVEPTKRYAKHIIDVSDLTRDDVVAELATIVKPYL